MCKNQVTVYTVGCIGEDGQKGIVLIHHDFEEVIDMMKCVASQGEVPTLEHEMLSIRDYVNQNQDNLSLDEAMVLL